LNGAISGSSRQVSSTRSLRKSLGSRRVAAALAVPDCTGEGKLVQSAGTRNSMPDACPRPEQLEHLLRERLREDEQRAVLQHLDVCPACRQLLEQMAGPPTWLSSAARAPAASRNARWPARLDELIDRLRTQPPTGAGVRRQESGLRQAPDPAGTQAGSFLQPSTKPGVLGVLGSYEVLEEIDRGAMGIVFKARDTTLNRIVAIKVLAPALAHNPAARARFLREARAAAAIAHEHVITIHAVEETREVPYLVMQFVAGKSLRQ
jgi:hypothetical protein